MLIRAGRAARDWMNRPGVTDRDLGGIFLAACILGGRKSRRPVALPFWSAAEARHQRRELQIGARWLAAFLDGIAAAAKAGLDELERLRRAEEISCLLGRTARSRLPDAANEVLRTSIVTARDLAATLDVSPQAALGLLHQLTETGLVREATNQKSWRAFVLSN
jgi:DNA-binding transcriptional ArsR family regulator